MSSSANVRSVKFRGALARQFADSISMFERLPDRLARISQNAIGAEMARLISDAGQVSNELGDAVAYDRRIQR